MKALIAAGGRGTRLRPITYSMNKHLIPVANKPMIFYALEKMAEAGITDVAININEGDTELPAAVGDGSTWGVRITYLEQKGGALGLAHIIKNAAHWLGDDSFIFYLGDNIILGSIVQFVEEFQRSGAQAFLALSEVPDPQRFGVPEINEQGEIVRVLEKPANPPSNYAVTGIYCYDKTIHDAIAHIQPSERGELEISDAHTALIELGQKVKYKIVDGWWKDTGKPYDLLEGNRLLLDLITPSNHASSVDSGVLIQGKVEIGDGAQIIGQSILRGPVAIGRNTIIRDSYIGPFTAIGQNVEVQSSEIENSIVMDEAEINCQKRIVDSIIGRNARITSVMDSRPSGHKLMIGENAQVEL